MKTLLHANTTLLLFIAVGLGANAFNIQQPSAHHLSTRRGVNVKKSAFSPPAPAKIPLLYLSNDNNNNNNNNKDEAVVVKVGSKEYYDGFLSRDLREEAEGRVTGDGVLIPTLKFAGVFTVLSGALVVGFMVSNGLLTLQ
jgi:hypothetical protein